MQEQRLSHRLMILKETFHILLKDKAPVHVILSALQDTYKDEIDGKKHSLLCHAIHYGHMNVVQELWPSAYRPDIAMLNPLICAVRKRNLEVIHLLLESGFEIPTTGYYILTDGISATFLMRSAMCIIMERDDVELMPMFMTTYNDEYEPLAHLSLKLNAEKCFDELLNLKHASLEAKDSDEQDILLLAASSNLSLLEKVIQHGSKDYGQVTRYRHRSSLHRCVSSDSYTRQDGSKANFIPSDVVDKIKLLVSAGAKASTYDQDQQLPLELLLSQPGQQIQTRDDIQPPYPLEQHSKIILESCKLLLDQMATEAREAAVPHRIFSHLQAYLQGLLINHCTKFTQTKFTDSVTSALDLIDDIALMFLKYGVDIHEDDPDTLLDGFFKQCITHTVKSRGESSTAKYLHEHILKLLVFGSRMTEKCLPGLRLILEHSPKHMKETVPMCVSMMDHELYQAFRADIVKEQEGEQSETDGKLVERRGSGRGHMGEETRRGEGTDNPYEIPGCQDLKQLCRIRIYKHVPKRKMVVYAESLPLPRALKSYLTLGFTL